MAAPAHRRGGPRRGAPRRGVVPLRHPGALRGHDPRPPAPRPARQLLAAQAHLPAHDAGPARPGRPRWCACPRSSRAAGWCSASAWGPTRGGWCPGRWWASTGPRPALPPPKLHRAQPPHAGLSPVSSEGAIASGVPLPGHHLPPQEPHGAARGLRRLAADVPDARLVLAGGEGPCEPDVRARDRPPAACAGRVAAPRPGVDRRDGAPLPPGHRRGRALARTRASACRPWRPWAGRARSWRPPGRLPEVARRRGRAGRPLDPDAWAEAMHAVLAIPTGAVLSRPAASGPAYVRRPDAAEAPRAVVRATARRPRPPSPQTRGAP